MWSNLIVLPYMKPATGEETYPFTVGANRGGAGLAVLVRGWGSLPAVHVGDLAVFPGHEDPPTPPVSAPLRRLFLEVDAGNGAAAVERFWEMVRLDLLASGFGDLPRSSVTLLEVVPPRCDTIEDGPVRFEWQFGVYVEGEHA